MSSTAIIVQARATSTRFPGKVLKKLAGRSVLEHVFHRCRSVEGVDIVCCATPANTSSDIVANEAERLGMASFRGSEKNVLDRYHQAAASLNADIIMRITSDCPLVDPEICTRVLHLRKKTGADYAANNQPPTWPHGMDCEAFTFEALTQAAREAKNAYEREHVTPWMRISPVLSHANLQSSNSSLSAHRWTLDYEEDYAFLEALFEHLPPWPTIPAMEEVLNVLKAHPEIAKINAARCDLKRLASAVRTND